MNKALNPIKKRYLKRVNPAYTYFTKLELQEELKELLQDELELNDEEQELNELLQLELELNDEEELEDVS